MAPKTRQTRKIVEVEDIEMSESPGPTTPKSQNLAVSTAVTTPQSQVVAILPQPPTDTDGTTTLQPLGALPQMDFQALMRSIPGETTIENLELHLVQN